MLLGLRRRLGVGGECGSEIAFAAFVPLAGPSLYKNLGLGWGNSVLGFIGVAFLPVPLLFSRYGGWLRERFPVMLCCCMLGQRDSIAQAFLLESLILVCIGLLTKQGVPAT